MTGTILLIVACVLALAAAASGAAASATASGAAAVDVTRSPHRIATGLATWLQRGAVLCLWGAVLRLVTAIMALDTSLAYVADQTRAGMGPAIRFAALWSGAEGSLLLFAAMASTALLVGHRMAPRWQQVGTALVTAGLALASWQGADPFIRLDLPPLSGAGMAPILEHWAMLIHPPLLYAGLCGAMTPALVRSGRGSPPSSVAGSQAAAHRLGLVAMAVLTVALGLGSAWAYVELGWGGWWAWDPIENVAVVVWLLLAGALHWKPLDRVDQVGTGLLGADVLWALCWPAVLGGAALTRTSLRTSVHAFADAAGLAVWLWPLTALAGLGFLLRVRQVGTGRSLTTEDVNPLSMPELRRRLPQLLLVIVGVIVAAGTYRPFIGGESTAGFYYSRMLFPVAILGAVLVGTAPLLRPGQERSAARVVLRFGLPIAAGAVLLATLAGWREWYQLGLLAAIGLGVGPVLATGRANIARLAGHLGILLILFAAVAGTASTDSVIRLKVGESGELDGHRIELVSTQIDSEAPLQASARVLIDGNYELIPSVTVYPERGLRLPEVSTRTTPWLDTQAVLRDVHPTEGALLTVLFRPWNQMVWWGVALLVLATALAPWSNRAKVKQKVLAGAG